MRRNHPAATSGQKSRLMGDEMRETPALDPTSAPDAPPRRRATPGGREHPNADALVAIVPTKADWALVQTKGWYRIPLDKAPTELLAGQISTLAFYLPKQFGDEAWQVCYFAPLLGVSTHPRSALLPEQPSHPRANQHYVRLALGPITALSHPIPSLRQRRIILIATTRAKLETAAEINDLYHDSPLEDTVWQAFKAEGLDAERQLFVDGDRFRRYALDFAIFGQQRNLNVECDGDTYHANPIAAKFDNRRNNFLTARGWSVLRYTTAEIRDELPRVMYDVHATIKVCGGIAHRAPASEPPNLLWQAALWDATLAQGRDVDPRVPAKQVYVRGRRRTQKQQHAPNETGLAHAVAACASAPARPSLWDALLDT
ncbi:MAG TPA: DUF559 domain-containing protein [Ktedonobacterales bacterium]|nr:DUF559 domain-containing protein [Ktedonobacterales bacterium]